MIESKVMVFLLCYSGLAQPNLLFGLNLPHWFLNALYHAIHIIYLGQILI